MSPNDRLRDLQQHMPELFEHVSVKGLKRLMAQVGNARGLGVRTGLEAVWVRLTQGRGSWLGSGSFRLAEALGYHESK